MGVKLQDLAVRNALSFPELEGKIVAVDAPNTIMSLFSFARKEGTTQTSELILDRTQRPISHLYGILYRVNFFYSKKIFPIFCFDGKDSNMKKLITKDKLNDFRFTERWYQQALKSGNKILARNIALSKEYMWQNILKESKALLSALGVPFIESPASGESQCAQLVKDHIASFSNSQDFDSLLFGCPHLLQNLSKSLKRKVHGRWTYQKIVPYTINLTETLQKLGINQFQLVDMALLLETDYFPGIVNIGPKTALKLIKQYGNIETVIAKINDRYDFSNLTEEITAKVRKIFLFPEVLTQFTEFSWTQPNETRILTLLCEEHHLNQERVQNNLRKLLDNFEKCSAYFTHNFGKPRNVQTTLDFLFG
jgi:flap endonuclease-1